MTPTTREAVERFTVEDYFHLGTLHRRLIKAAQGDLVRASDYDALAAEVEGLRRDAERYRGIREALCEYRPITYYCIPLVLRRLRDTFGPVQFDAAIDATTAALAPSRGEEA